MLQLFIVPFYIPREHISGISRQGTPVWTRYCCFMNHFKVLKLKTTIIFHEFCRVFWRSAALGWIGGPFDGLTHACLGMTLFPTSLILLLGPSGCPSHVLITVKWSRRTREQAETRTISRGLRTTTLSLPASCIDPSKSHGQAQSQSGRVL